MRSSGVTPVKLGTDGCCDFDVGPAEAEACAARLCFLVSGVLVPCCALRDMLLLFTCSPGGGFLLPDVGALAAPGFSAEVYSCEGGRGCSSFLERNHLCLDGDMSEGRSAIGGNGDTDSPLLGPLPWPQWGCLG